MTVIRPNSISGVSSITTNGGDLSLFRSDGTTSDIIVNNVTSGIITATTFSGNVTGNISGATATFTGDVGVGGKLTYEDVTNIDSVGVITARDGLRVTGISTFAGNLLPSANNTHDLGATGTRWANAYVNDMHFSNKGSSNSVDGTWGDWTLQEGENKIFMINNRTGKKYSLKMEEV